MKLDFRRPFIKVEFINVEGEKVDISNVEFGGDIIQMTVSKSLAQTAGSFSIEMIARDNLTSFYNAENFPPLLAKSNAYEFFSPSGIVDIYINGKEVMIGIIDDISRRMSIGADGKPTRMFLITGRDFGAYLVDHKIWYDNIPVAGRQEQFTLIGGLATFGVIGDQSPSKIIEDVVKKYFVEILNKKLEGIDNVFKFVDGDTITDKFIASSEESGGGLSLTTYCNYFPISFAPWNYQGDLYTFIKTFASYPFNELFVDTGDRNVILGAPRSLSGNNWVYQDIYRDSNFNKGEGLDKPLYKKGTRNISLKSKNAYIILRPTPFDDEYFGLSPNDLPSLLTMQDLQETKIDIDDGDILSKDLKKGRNNIPSIYSVIPTSGSLIDFQGNAFIAPEYDERALRRYGFNYMQVKLDGFNTFANNFAKSGTNGVDGICSKLQKKLKSWYSVSDILLSGVFVIKGNENVRIGNRLDYNSLAGKIEEPYEEGYYYIIGVEHSYSFGGAFTTTINVDRGVSKMLIGEIHDSKLQRGII